MKSKSIQKDDIVTFFDHPTFEYYKGKKPLMRVVEPSTEARTAVKVLVITAAIRRDCYGGSDSFQLMDEFFCDPLELMVVGVTH